MSKKVLGIIEGVVITVLGILVAIFGGQAVMDIYFGVLFCIAGASLIALNIATLVRTKLLSFALVFAACALTTFGVLLLASPFSTAYLFEILVYLVIAFGGALVFYGIYSICKKNVFYGIGQIVLGAAAATLGICFILIPEFRVVFWIVVGCLIGVYGILYIVFSILRKEIDEE